MDLFKKAALPSIEDFAKEIIVKRNLTNELGRSIRAVQEAYLGKTLISDSEHSNTLCNSLEAIFIHGLKENFVNRMSSVFGSSDKIPEPQFWNVACSYSHKDVIAEINRLTMIYNDIGRCRAWIRYALNDGLMQSYLGTMLSDKSGVQKCYSPTSYLRDDEQPDIMKKLLEGIDVFCFELSCNDSALNIWNSVPLALANLWTPPITPQPVMPAVDVIDFFADAQIKQKNSPKTSKKEPVLIPASAAEVEESSDIASSDILLSDSMVVKQTHVQKSNTFETQSAINPLKSDLESLTVRDSSLENEAVLPVEINCLEETVSKVSSSDSFPDFAVEVTPEMMAPNVEQIGNKLKEDSGWSSTYDCESSYEADQTYDSLLQSYNKNLGKIVIGTPELADTFNSAMGKCEDDLNDFSLETKSPDLDFEFVPKYLAAEHADAETKKLMSVIGQISQVQGLNDQNFECNACGRPIGLIYGKARLCHYDGHNYCYECHNNEEEYIPARIVHNWDFKQYPVSSRAKTFISRVVKDPLLDIKVLNPVIYTAVEEMAQLQLLRTQLTFLRSYIFTCKQSIVDDLRMRLWPREYLYEHVHLYAIDDLLEIPSGQLAQALQKAITFAKKHVSGCQLCLLKGFICEVCNNPAPIYPFDIESTYHCDRCLAVYHDTCMDANKYCPKCIRRLKRQQALESAASD